MSGSEQTPQGHRGTVSAEEAITSAHRSIEDLLEKMETALAAGNEAEAREAFAHLRAALEAHFDQEDHLYYPPIRTLRPEHQPSVERFGREHVQFSEDASAIHALLEEGSLGPAHASLERLRHSFALHEAAEEEMLRSLDQEIESAT